MCAFCLHVLQNLTNIFSVQVKSTYFSDFLKINIIVKLKYFKKLSMWELLREEERLNMNYYHCVWPGAYNFKSEIKLFITWFKNQMDILNARIEETEKKLAK